MNTELLVKSKELVDEIYKNMGVVETCTTITEKIKELPVCFNDNNTKVVALDGVLAGDELEEIRNDIIVRINNRAKLAEGYLKELLGERTEEPQKEEVVKSEEVTEKVNRMSEISDSEFMRMVESGMKQYEVAEIIGCSQGNVSTRANKIRKNMKKAEEAPKKKQSNQWEERAIPDTQETINTIKALYVKGPFDMKMLAEEFHCEKKTMFDFCQKHGLKKPSKNDPFNGR